MIGKNEVFELKLDKSKFPNKTMGRYKDVEIRIKGGIEGQRVLARISRKKKDHMEAKIVEVLEKSPMEVAAKCEHFGICGGCSYQNMEYSDELKYKKRQIEGLFQEQAIDIDFETINGSPSEREYRNKMEYTFGDEYKDGPLTLGLHRKGRFYETVTVENCNIVDEDFRKILLNSLNFFKAKGTACYNKRNTLGILRHLVVRKALSTGEILINLVTTSQGEIDTKGFVDAIISDQYKGLIKGILHSSNDGLSDIVVAEKLDVLYGEDFITEEILGLKFNISPFSFFQTNTFGAEKLYGLVREFVGDISGEIVFDLYSGTGTIAQIMAPLAKEVVAIEIVEEATKKAIENARINGIDNIKFIAGDVLEAVETLDIKPDLIVLDPPRDGIHPKAIEKILDFDPKTFVYVSCNPVTLARDIHVFLDRGYKIKRATIMDQFPRTPHVECLVGIQKIQ